MFAPALEPDLDSFVVWLFDQAGLDARVYRPIAMQRRLPSCLRKLRVKCVDSAKDLLESKPELVPTALNALLIGVTEFFRDADVFTALRTKFLPELLKSRTHPRVYSAGASDGHELYSVAMLLAEAGVLQRSTLTGVDCRPHAIHNAQAGRFHEQELGGMPVEWREKYFHRQDAHWSVREELRSPIQWRTSDLFTFDEGAWDIILFRNVAIYFDAGSAAAAWERLCGQLSSGGLLITGKAEKPPQTLPLVRLSNSLYRKKEQ